MSTQPGHHLYSFQHSATQPSEKVFSWFIHHFSECAIYLTPADRRFRFQSDQCNVNQQYVYSLKSWMGTTAVIQLRSITKGSIIEIIKVPTLRVIVQMNGLEAKGQKMMFLILLEFREDSTCPCAWYIFIIYPPKKCFTMCTTYDISLSHWIAKIILLLILIYFLEIC